MPKYRLKWVNYFFSFTTSQVKNFLKQIGFPLYDLNIPLINNWELTLQNSKMFSKIYIAHFYLKKYNHQPFGFIICLNFTKQTMINQIIGISVFRNLQNGGPIIHLFSKEKHILIFSKQFDL